ncbi:hypothetical protein DFH06DRAFT_736787 [Mycena polygramma]|nr:hypothetical protein DFH06DRAFT_736787 [Mycena polygramma]
MSITSNSTTSLVSTTTVSSRTPLTRSAVPQKDFQAAFADLQSTYGFGGSGLYYGFGGSALSSMPKQNKSTVLKQKKSSSPDSTASPTPRAPPKGTEDYEAAVADLQSTSGLGGAASSPAPKPKDPENRSLLSKLMRSSSSTSPSHRKTKVRTLPPPTQHMRAL